MSELKNQFMQELNEFGLTQNHMKIIHSIFEKYPEIQKVLVYGSRAMGTFRPGSDIDMTILGNLPSQKLFHIINDFDDSMLPFLIDISIFSKLDNPDLIEHINRVGKVIYEQKIVV